MNTYTQERENVKCINCKWFEQMTMSDEYGVVFVGICNAVIGEEQLMTESDAESDAPCDFYVQNYDDDTTA